MSKKDLTSNEHFDTAGARASAPPSAAPADGSFPQPIRLGARAVGWIESEVDAWIREQIAASRSSAE